MGFAIFGDYLSKRKIPPNSVLVIKQIQDIFTKLLNRNSDGYDVFDFRVGTLIGTTLICLIPFFNEHFDRLIPDIPIARNTLIIIQILIIFASYHVIFIKKWANEIGNLFSLVYAFIISFACYFGHFQNIHIVSTLIFLLGISGMFKTRVMMTLYVFFACGCFIGLIWLSDLDPHPKKILTPIIILLFATFYYVFYIKLNYVDKLKNREIELMESESWFRNIFDNAPVGIVMLNEAFRVFKFNQYFQKITGYTEGELFELGLRNLIHQEDYMTPEQFKNFFNTENSYAEQRLFHKSGKTIWVRLTMSQMTVNGKIYTITMFNDISSERFADSQLQESNRQLKAQNESLEEFSYVISHDLQEPLRMITSFSQFVKIRYVNPLGNEDANKDFEYVIDGAKRMSTLIKDMKEYTQWSAKNIPVEAVNVREVLLETQQNLMIAIQRSEAVINASNLPIIMVNRLVLVQVFQNLISNAIKYRHPKRQPVIDITVEKSSGEWIFKFQDNGIGFDNKHKDRVFGIFQRLNNDRVMGNGIGLAICKRIIVKQGGRIWAESVVDEGSIFSFSIPFFNKNHVYTEGVTQEDIMETAEV